MKVTPLDIRRKEFKRGMRGYADNEVDVFLDDVADEFERLFQENMELQDRLGRLDEQIADHAQLKTALEKTLVSAQLQADQLIANARKEAELILRDAELKARGIVSDSYGETQRVQQSLIGLKHLEEDFRFKFRSLLEGHLRLLGDVPLTASPAPVGVALPAPVAQEPAATVEASAVSAEEQAHEELTAVEPAGTPPPAAPAAEAAAETLTVPGAPSASSVTPSTPEEPVLDDTVLLEDPFAEETAAQPVEQPVATGPSAEAAPITPAEPGTHPFAGVEPSEAAQVRGADIGGAAPWPALALVPEPQTQAAEPEPAPMQAAGPEAEASAAIDSEPSPFDAVPLPPLSTADFDDTAITAEAALLARQAADGEGPLQSAAVDSAPEAAPAPEYAPEPVSAPESAPEAAPASMEELPSEPEMEPPAELVSSANVENGQGDFDESPTEETVTAEVQAAPLGPIGNGGGEGETDEVQVEEEVFTQTFFFGKRVERATDATPEPEAPKKDKGRDFEW